MKRTEPIEFPTVFVSHCPEDKALARDLRDRIAARTGSSTTVVLSEDIPDGDDWYSATEERLGDARWFVLVMNTRVPGLDLPLYEAGIYQALHGEERRMVCLHHPDIDPPEALSSTVAVEAIGERIDDLVNRIANRPWGNGDGPRLRVVASE